MSRNTASRRSRAPLLDALRSQWRYLVSPRPWPIELPTVVQFPVNDICDSKCQMCNIWQQKRDREIAPGEVRQLFANPLFRRVRTVGFNGGEPTLRQDLAALGAALCDALPGLQGVSLITNALHAQRAMQRIDELAAVMREREVQLNVMVSLDGVGELHDRVRGVQGNFDQALSVIDYLRARPELCSLRIGCTVIRENVHGLHELHDFCVSRGLYVKYRLGVPNRRLYNLEPPGPKQIGRRTWLDTRPFGLDTAQRWHFAQFLYGLAGEYEPALAQVQFYRSLAGQVLHGNPRRAGCDWQHRGVTVSSRGEILYCAVQSKVLGDGLLQDAQGLYLDNTDYLGTIVRDKCADCAHDYVGPPGGTQQAQLVADRLLSKVGSSLADARRSALGRAAYSAKRRFVDPVRFAADRRRRLAATSVPGTNDGRGRTVLVCGWYGTETLGDKAILGAVVDAIRRLDGDARVVVASLDPACTRLTVEQMPELAGCDVIHVDEAPALLTKCRALVFGGGPLMAIREIAAMEALFVRARTLGVPGIVAGCGVGPLGADALNDSIRGLLSAATRRIYRDPQSRALASSRWSLTSADDAVCDDPARTWLQGLAVPALRDEAAPTLALGLRDWPYQQYAPQLGEAEGERIRRRFEHEAAAALGQLIEEIPGLRILPIPFCTHAVGGDDRWLYWRLLRSSPRLRAACDASLLAMERTPLQYASLVAGADAMLTMRFHSLVFASTLGVPAVAIDYTGGRGKTHALAGKVGCASFRIEDLRADLLVTELRAALARGRAPPVADEVFTTAFARAWGACVAPRSATDIPA